LAPEVNEAVERAHKSGILTAASLMVTAPAALDAIERAKGMPGLRVGLHLVLVDGPMSPCPERLLHPVDETGRLPRGMVRAAFGLVLGSRARRQLAEQIRAQFNAYRQTGLPMDHVDVHKHFQLHPIVANMIFEIGREYKMRALRVPVEPRIELPTDLRAVGYFVMRRWASIIRARARSNGLLVPDAVFGLAWSGGMTKPRIERLLRSLPAGIVEIYTHPATRNDFRGHADGYDYAGELAALCSAEAIKAVRGSGYLSCGYTDCLQSRQ
jgi:hopanoid biosynthesis associated protein HpnK